MARLANIPTEFLSLHPISANEFALPLLHLWHEEVCRLYHPSGISIHLIGHAASNPVDMIIYLGPPGSKSKTWRVRIHMDLWLSGELQRTAEGMEPLFEVHPLGWGSEVHMRLVRKWGVVRGVQAAVVPGLSRLLYVWRSA